MKKTFLLLMLVLASMTNLLQAAPTKVYILPLQDEIDARAWQHTRRALDEANDVSADLLIVKMNTYGGAIDAADSIRSALLAFDKPTVAFVDHNAASAGALIALACDTVLMTPGSSMGAATVVDQTGQPLPDKYQAYMSSMMRSTAESHGKVMVEGTDSMRWRRDPEIASAMVIPGSVVSFSPSEALKVGYSDATVYNLNEAYEWLGIADPEVTMFVPTVTDDILGFLSNTAVRAILVALILGGLFMEMHTPGLGFAAAVSLVATCLYLLPMLVVGTLQPWILICLIIGVVLMALEIFVIPGFGVCGFAGIAAILAALFGAILPSVPDGSQMSLALLSTPLFTVGAGVIVAIGLVAWLTSKYGPMCVRRHTELMLTQDVNEGYIGVDMTPATLVGNHATTLTDMRPAGKIGIGDKSYDAVSTGNFIAAGSRVRIVRYENAQLYVESCPNLHPQQ